MAVPAAMRQMFVRLGCDNPTALSITDDQGIEDLTELEFLNDHGVESLCKQLARPGGTVANPNAGVAGQPTRIPNPGLAVSIKAEENIKLAAYYVRHMKRISRTAQVALIDRDIVRTMRGLKESEEQHEPPQDKPTINHKNWSMSIEAIEEYFRNHLGESKIPLAYVIRRDKEVAAEADDPQANYETPQDEMISRAPHTITVGANVSPHPKYIVDNRKVWEIISNLTRENKCWSYVKPFQRKRDGRGAFLALDEHYLGPNNANNMADEAETKLANACYSKEGKRWNFESYVTLHTDQHQILQQLEDDNLYKGIDETSKVRHFLNGVNSNELNFLKAQVLSTPRLRNSFDECVTLYKDYIKASTHERDRTLNISKFGTTRKNGRKATGHGRKSHVGTKRKHADLGGDDSDGSTGDESHDDDSTGDESHDDDSTGDESHDDDSTGDDSYGDSNGDTSGNEGHNNSDLSESHNEDAESHADSGNDKEELDDKEDSSSDDDDYDDVEEQDVDDRYYTPKEYSWMSRGQRKRLKRLNKQHRE